jgi:inosine-uridine nucleoside N-ribohydrolase
VTTTRRRILAAVLVLALGGAACSDDDGGAEGVPTTEAPGGEASPMPVVVDTDLAGDDLTALWFVLSSPDVDVVAVTVSGTGEVRCPHGVEVARRALAVTGDDDVPVACGRSTPLDGDHAFPSEWRDAADDAWGLDLPEPTGAVEETTAVALLTESLSPGGVTLLALGPLTNVAEAFRADDALAGRVESIVLMGGAVDVPGNVFAEGVDEPVAEWNMYIDPTAADEVIGSGAPIVMVGLDATNQTPITGDFLELLRVNATTDAAAFTQELLLNNPLVYSAEAYFWDQLAAAVVVDPGLVTTEEARIDVMTSEGTASGRTIRSQDGDPILVALDADALEFEELLVATLARLGPDEAPTAPPMTIGEILIRYDGSTCTYEGPATVGPGRMRMAFESNEPGAGAAVAHLSGELTVEELLQWVEDHPGENPPGIDRPVTAIGPGAVTYLDVVTGIEVAVCGTETGLIELAGTITVE